MLGIAALATPAVAAGHQAQTKHRAPAVRAGQQADPTIYDSTTTPLPPNLVSVGFEADAASELGNQIAFSGTARDLNNVVVTMSSWGCETGAGYGGPTYGNPGACVTTNGATFPVPITLDIYNVGNDGQSVGSLIGTDTQTFNIPYRPSASPATSNPDCDGTTWYDAAANDCFNGLATNITFDLSSLNLILPNSVIYGVNYDTSDYGSSPNGCNTSNATECPIDSLNVALSEENAPSVGTDPLPGTIYWDTSDAGDYCDGDGNGQFGLDSPGDPSTEACWEPGPDGTPPYYIPAVQFNATTAPSGITSSPASSQVGTGTGDPDLVTVTGNNVNGSPTGNVTFYVCGPTTTPTSCTSSTPGAVSVGSSVLSPEGGDSATGTSPAAAFLAPGTWCYAAYYAGNASYSASSDTSTSECLVVSGLGGGGGGSGLQIVTKTLPPGTAGVKYTGTLQATGGTPGYKWTLVSNGGLTTLKVKKSGAVVAKKPAAGDYRFQVTVTDHSHPAQSATGFVTLDITS